MARKGYKTFTIDEELIKELIKYTGAKTVPEAIRKLIPKNCMKSYIRGGHIFLNATIEQLVIEDVAYIDLSGLKVRADYMAEFLVRIIQKDLVLGILVYLLSQNFKILAKPEIIRVNHSGRFLVDTGATITAINTALLPEEVRLASLSAWKKEEIQNIAQSIKVAKGIAKISINGSTIEDPVVLLDAPHSDYHIIGIETLRRIFSDRILIDFRNARVCKIGE